MVTGYAELPSSCLPSPFPIPLCLPLSHSAFPMVTILHLKSILPPFSCLIPLYQLWISFLYSGFQLCCILLLSLICCDVIVISDEQSIVWMNLSTLACIGNRQSKLIHELVGNHTTINHVMYFLPCYHDNIQKGFQRLPSDFVSYLIFLARN